MAEATRAFKEANNSPADQQRHWAARLALMKEDKNDYYFRMTYFHHLYNRVNGDIMDLELLMSSNNGKNTPNGEAAA